MSAPTDSSSTLVAIGNFDGVHRGHVAVLSRASQEAEAAGVTPVALTFDPPPAVVLGRTPPELLTTVERKVELIVRAVPAMRVVVKRFDRALASLSPAEFAERVLVHELRAARVVVGENFRFGRGRAGDLAALAELGQRLGFVARATEIVGDERGPWSSTRVREAILGGDWEDVMGVLGRPHALSGIVAEGDRRGRTIGFPTANLADVRELLPPRGVYAVLVDQLDASGKACALARGVANIGTRPTVGAGPSTEAHLFDFKGDLYGARLRVHLMSHLRPEIRFDGLDALKDQIGRDARAARALLASQTPDPGAGGAWF